MAFHERLREGLARLERGGGLRRSEEQTAVGGEPIGDAHAERELGPDHIQRTGESIRRHAERIARLADDLYDVSRLEASSLLLAPRPVELLAGLPALQLRRRHRVRVERRTARFRQ